MLLDRGVYRRVVTQRGLKNYEQYLTSGLHRRLVESKLVLDHVDEPAPLSETNWARLLTPEQLTFISYPYEWSFDELRDAALLTLKVQENALALGMSLKDASPYNVQFRGSKPVFIDTLSFENNTGGAWIAYEQFCRQFLAPLLLMSYGWSEASQYLRVDLNGFPLAQASRLLPPRSYLNVGALLHVHLHARSTRPGQASSPGSGASDRDGKAALAQSLYKTIENLRRPSESSEWTNYYQEARYYTSSAQESKQKEVAALAATVRPELVYDLGANTGLFSRALALDGAVCIAFERDTNCVNRLYLEERSKDASRILPLVMDLENPSPGLGFGLNTTLSLADRPQADLVLCLALIHHLRFSANLPLCKLAAFMARLGRWLLIEFVPAEDPASQMLINGRDGFDDYTPDAFLEAFSGFYDLRRQTSLEDSARGLYLFERRG
jgi:SAM-dependent methyltransferase